MQNNQPTYLPTTEQIDEACRQIRARWTDTDHRWRSADHHLDHGKEATLDALAVTMPVMADLRQ